MSEITASRGNYVLVQSLIGSGHALSHFYWLALPPLFPVMQAELGLSYTALGFLLTLLAISSGGAQVIAGFLVDRFGARVLLVGGLAIMGTAISAIGFVHSYWAMAALIVVSGIGNAVFHPADYVILNASVPRERLGQAFSIHTFTGNLGFAAAPPVILLLSSLFGWRGALIAAGSLSIIVMAFVLAFGSVLHESHRAKKAETADVAHSGPTGWRLLFTPALLVMFSFYIITAVAGSGMQSFLVSALVDFHGLSLDASNFVLTGLLVAGAAGVLVGGYIADHTTKQAPIIIAAFVASAVLVTFCGLMPLPAMVLFASFTAIGLLQGITRPSRDIITRAVSPDRDVGKVFAFVSTGMNVGGAIAPLTFGLLLDHGQPQFIFLTIGAFFLLGVATIGTSRMYVKAARAARPEAAD
jgi:FSR family fosmidomycin resistance protein-like MFS transporter